MDTENDQHQSGQAELNDFGKIALRFLKFGQNATNTLSQVFEEMTPKEWIRLVMIVGTYLLLRPYAQSYLGKRQVESMERANAKEKAAQISPNELRGEGRPADYDDDDDEAEASGSAWGEKARTRQRVMLKHLLEAEERRKQEEDDDKDIADLLED
ncbi:hypothetical protein ACO1O0_009073 [Amphichorda felina]